MMLIDTNKERLIDLDFEKSSKDAKNLPEQNVYLGKHQLTSGIKASIHIGTLAKYTGHGPGDYALAVIKQMTGTENFLAWPEEKRKCSLEKYEKCQMRTILEENERCGCSPFQLLPAKGNTEQVFIYTS